MTHAESSSCANERLRKTGLLLDYDIVVVFVQRVKQAANLYRATQRVKANALEAQCRKFFLRRLLLKGRKHANASLCVFCSLNRKFTFNKT